MRPVPIVLVLLAVALALLVAGLSWVAGPEDGERRSPSPPTEPEIPPAEEPVEGAPPTDPPYAEEDRVRVEGLVLAYGTGEAVEGARVRVSTRSGTWEAVTDERGRFVFDLPPRRVSLSASADGFVPAGCAADLTRAGKSARAPTLFLRKARLSLRGRVTDEEGNPVAGARCEVNFRDSVPTIAVTDADGRFGPVPAIWWLGAVIWVEADGFLDTAAGADIMPGRTRDVTVDIRLLRPRWASGRVTDEDGRGLEGARLTSRDSDTEVFSGREGRFRWPIAPDTSEALFAEKDGYIALEYSGVAAGGPETTIVLERATRAEGRLLTHDGRPAARVGLSFRSGGWTRDTETDDAGRFTLAPMLPGTGSLHAHIGDVTLGRFEIEVPEPGPLTGLTLRLPEPDAISCVVTDVVTGAPVEGATAFAGEYPHTRPVAVSGADGTFKLRVAPGEAAYVGLLADGYRPGSLRYRPGKEEPPVAAALDPLATVRLRTVDGDGRPIAGTRIEAGRRLEFYADHEGVAVFRVPVGATERLVIVFPGLASRPIDIALVPGVTLDLGDVVLTPRAETVEIRVVTEDGKPIPGAVVMRRGGTDPIVVDDAGRALVPEAESYRIYAPGMARSKIEAPGPDGATVTLRKGAPFVGRVVGPDGKGVPGVDLYCSVPVDGVPTDAEGRFELDGAAAGTAAILSIYPDQLSGTVCEVWARAGEEVVLDHPGFATIVVLEEEDDWVYDAVITLPDREDLRNGGALTMSGPKYITLPDEVRIPVAAGRVILSYSRGSARVHHHLRLEPGEVVRLEPPEGDPPEIVVLPAAGLEEEVVDYRVSLVTPDVPLGDLSSDTEYRVEEPVFHLGPPVRLRVADLSFATYYTAPLDLSEGATITVPLTEPGEVIGTLRDAAGEPVVGAKVRLRAPFGFKHWEWDETADDGEFYLGCDLPVGPQTIEVRREGRLPVLRRVEVGRGRETEVELRVD